jgi:hypothetical protein
MEGEEFEQSAGLNARLRTRVFEHLVIVALVAFPEPSSAWHFWLLWSSIYLVLHVDYQLRCQDFLSTLNAFILSYLNFLGGTGV